MTSVGGRHSERSAGAGQPWSLGLLALGAFATGTDSFLIAGVLPEVARDLGSSTSAVGFTVSLFAVGYAVGGPACIGSASGKDPRVVLASAMLVFAVGNACAALAPNTTALGAARLVAAVGAGVFVPMALSVAAEWGGESRRARSTSIVVAGASLALVFGAPLGTLIADAASWRVGFAAVGAVGVLVATAIPMVVPRLRVAPAPRWADRRALLRNRAVLAVLGVTLLANTAAFVVYPYLGAVFADQGSRRVALLLFTFGCGAVLGTVLGGRAADAFGATRVVVVASLVFALAHAFSALTAGSFAAGVVYMCVWGLAGWAVVPAQQSRLLALAVSDRPLLLSLNSSAIHLGTGLGAAIGGGAVGVAGASSLWIVATATAVAALVLVPLGASRTAGAVP